MSLAIRDLAEAARTPHEAPRWLVEELIPERGLSVLAAAPKAGKTLLSMALAMAVGAGSPHRFLGRKISRSRVLLVEMEGSESSLVDRATRISIERAEPFGSGEVYVSHRPRGFSLPQSFAELNSAAEEIDAGLIVLDPLASLLNGADENSASSLAPILNALAELSRERAVLVIHHSSKPASDKGAGARDPFASIRGSSAIFAAADSAAILDTSEDGLRAKLTIRPRDARRSIIDLERDAEGLLWRNASAPVVA